MNMNSHVLAEEHKKHIWICSSEENNERKRKFYFNYFIWFGFKNLMNFVLIFSDVVFFNI